MAGLYDRIKQNAEDRVPVHLLDALISGYMAGHWTKVQAVEALNRAINTPLDQQAEFDLNDLAQRIDVQPNATSKAIFLLATFSPLNIAAEMGEITEAQWRSRMGI